MSVPMSERAAQCQFRNKCRRWIRHEGYEPWVFCQIKSALYRMEHPVNPKQVGLPPEDHLCEMDGKANLDKCDIYKKGIKIPKFTEMFPKQERSQQEIRHLVEGS